MCSGVCREEKVNDKTLIHLGFALFDFFYSIIVLLLSLIGIVCSVICLQSSKYFHFESLRNDTFYDKDKKQPQFGWLLFLG